MLLNVKIENFIISAVIDDRRSFTESPVLSWIDMAESMYSALGGRV